jgi:hypothetical protein
MPGGRPKGDPNHPRRGNGPGKGQWGGPAKGASTSRILPGDPDGIAALARDPTNKALKDSMRAELWQRLHHIALNGENETVQVTAADKLLDRIDGKPKQTQEIEARVASHVVRAPAKPADAAEWAATYAPKEATE